MPQAGGVIQTSVPGIGAGWAMLFLFFLAGCSDRQTAGTDADSSELSGVVTVDGSSTVFPISEAVAEEFLAVAPGIRVSVGVSGSGGGFKKFVVDETDINDSSRVIRETEIAEASDRGIDYIEFPIARDGLSIVVNKNNTWADSITTNELRRIWQPGSAIQSWNEIRPEWPDVPLRLYGPGTDSGTFEYFTDVIVGEMGAARPDFTASEDDNVLVQGISGDEYALGFFGYAYYKANTDKLKILPVDSGSGPVLPTNVTIKDGSYFPLSREIFIYVNKESLARKEVSTFVEFYLRNASYLSGEVGYIPLPDSVYTENIERLKAFLGPGPSE